MERVMWLATVLMSLRCMCQAQEAATSTSSTSTSTISTTSATSITSITSTSPTSSTTSTTTTTQPSASCPEKLFSIPGSRQCFRHINEFMTWDEAWTRCILEGLVLAQPDDNIAIDLRQYIYDNGFGGGFIWVSARGTGTTMSWWTGPDAWPSNSSSVVNQDLLDPDVRYRQDTNGCLILSVSWGELEDNPMNPYYVWECADERPTLCEGKRIGEIEAVDQDVWSLWTSWSSCSVSCGSGGTRSRSRLCTKESIAGCQGVRENKKACDYVSCCPNYMVGVPGSTQCFKFINEQLTWELARQRCISEGLVLAQPEDSIAIALRDKIVNTYGTMNFHWLDARDDGQSSRNLSWSCDGSTVNPDLMKPGILLVENRCLGMDAWAGAFTNSPTTPYYDNDCLRTSRVLCQGCPSDMVRVPGSNQCFKMLDQQLKWDSASDSCALKGMVLAHPSDKIAVELRTILVESYRDRWAWVDATNNGTRTYIKWSRNASPVNRDLMKSGVLLDSRRCLAMNMWGEAVAESLSTPYDERDCSVPNWVLCEDEGKWDWGPWSSSSCSVSCGRGGVITWIRYCSTASGCCRGLEQYTAPCTYVPCPEDGCPWGMVSVPGTTQCFKIIDDLVYWPSANARCESEGLVLAQPSENISVDLRKHLMDTYGGGQSRDQYDFYTWVDARGNGIKMAWSSDDSPVRIDLIPAEEEDIVESYWCMAMELTEEGLSKYRTIPYGFMDCFIPVGARVLCQESPTTNSDTTQTPGEAITTIQFQEDMNSTDGSIDDDSLLKENYQQAIVYAVGAIVVLLLISVSVICILRHHRRTIELEALPIIGLNESIPSSGSNQVIENLAFEEETEFGHISTELRSSPHDKDRFTHFMKAVMKGNCNEVRMLLKNGADIDSTSGEKDSTPLIEAAMVGDFDMCSILLHHGANPNATDDEGFHSIYSAAQGCHSEVIQLILDYGGDPQLPRTGFSYTAADHARNLGHTQLADWMHSLKKLTVLDAELVRKVKNGDAPGATEALEKGSDPNIICSWPSYEIGPLIFYAVAHEDELVVHALLKKSVQVDMFGINNTTSLLQASINKNINIAKMLLFRGADPNKTSGKTNITPLFASVLNGNCAMAELLLKKGANINQVSSQYNTSPLLEAVNKGNCNMAELFIKKGASIDLASGEYNMTPLLQAVMKNNYSMVEMLIKHNASLDLVSGQHAETPLLTAVVNDNSAIVELLIMKGASIEKTSGINNNPPLIDAVMYGHMNVCQKLLENGANTDITSSNGLHSIYLATEKGDRNMIKLIIKYGGDPKLKVHGHSTAADLARKKNDSDLAEWLDNQRKLTILDAEDLLVKAVEMKNSSEATRALLLGAEPNITCSFDTYYSEPVLHSAVRNEDIDLVKVLLDSKTISLNLIGGDKMTVLCSAVLKGNFPIVRLLLVKGANPDLASGDPCRPAQPPIVHATLARHQRIIALLLQHNANPDERDSQGCHSIFYAAGCGHKDTIGILIDYGADPALIVNGITAADNARNMGHSDLGLWLEKQRKLLRRSAKDVDATEMYCNETGILCFFNFIRFPNGEVRKGAKQDGKNVKNTFQKLQYSIDYHENLTKSETLLALYNLAQDIRLWFKDSLIIIISSHGLDGKNIVTSDGESVDINEIKLLFTNTNCPQMKNKPKVIFANWCRGTAREKVEGASNATEITDNALQEMEMSTNNDTEYVDALQPRDEIELPTHMAIIYSVSDGILSRRNKKRGSYFIQHLCETINKTPEEELSVIVDTVADKMKKENLHHPNDHYERPFRKFVLKLQNSKI